MVFWAGRFKKLVSSLQSDLTFFPYWLCFHIIKIFNYIHSVIRALVHNTSREAGQVIKQVSTWFGASPTRMTHRLTSTSRQVGSLCLQLMVTKAHTLCLPIHNSSSHKLNIKRDGKQMYNEIPEFA